MPFGDLSCLMTVTHELKAPLALVRQLSLELESTILDEQERMRLIRQITLTTERALRLTADLTRSARLEDSLFDLEPLNVQQICEEAAHELSPLYVAHGREIRVVARQHANLVIANKDLLRRVLLNFGDNALHYGESEKPVELKVKSSRNDEMVRIGVRDYGPAVSINAWQAMQDRLGRSGQLLNARPQSSGVGLLIAGQFALAMNGRIGATRHRDGATFYVDLNASTQMSLL